jgi:hypothetical protein
VTACFKSVTQTSGVIKIPIVTNTLAVRIKEDLGARISKVDYTARPSRPYIAMKASSVILFFSKDNHNASHLLKCEPQRLLEQENSHKRAFFDVLVTKVYFIISTSNYLSLLQRY